MSGDFTGNLIHTQRELRSFGITSEATAGAIQSLGTGMSDFTRMDKFSREELTKTVLKFTTLGVSVEDTTKLLEMGTKTLGMSNEQALTLQANLVKTAKGIGIAPGQMVQGFASAAPRLAAHGNAMEKVFEGLALQSKNTGASIDELLGVAAGFDTFESAAQKTSQLNAMFGTQLNSVELLNASEEERIQIMQASLAASGKSIDTMGRFEIKSLAQILGVDDGAVRRMFGGAAEGLEDLEKKASAAKSEVNLEDAMTKTVSIQERLVAGNEAFKNTSIEHVLPALKKQADGLTKNKKLMNDFVKAGKLAGTTYGALIDTATNLQNTYAWVAGTEAVVDLKNTVISLLSPLNSVWTVLASIGALFMSKKVLGGAKKFFGGAKKFFTKGWGGIKSGAGKAWGGIKSGAGKALSATKSGYGTVARGASRIAGKVFPSVRKIFGAVAKGIGRFAGPIGAALFSGVEASNILSNTKLSKRQKASALLTAGGGLLGGVVGGLGAGMIGSVGGPLAIATSILGAGAGEWLGRMLAGDKDVQNLLVPHIIPLLPDGSNNVEILPSNPTTAPVNSPRPSRPALVPPRITPTATATNAQTASITSTMGKMTGNTSEKLQPVFNVAVQVGDERILSKVVAKAINNGNTLAGVPTSNT